MTLVPSKSTSRPSKKQVLLTPSQAKCKRPRVVNYKDDKTKQQKARDIIILYVECGLGYSPIRHVIGLPNDKLVEDVIRQHMLGRNNVDEANGELFCPQSRYLSDSQVSTIKRISSHYMTENDPYVLDMIDSRKWSDEPAYKPNTCKTCGTLLDPEWLYCPFCNTKM